MRADVLIVDDEKDIRELISGILADADYAPRVAADSDSALREINSRCPALVLLDIWLQGSRLDGLEILHILHERYPQLPVVIISGHGNIETAVTAIRSGAYDYIEKPFKTDKLLLTVERAIENARLQRENSELLRKAGIRFELVGRSAAIERLNTDIDKLALTNSRVMLEGAAGSGKELVARLLHMRSPRADRQFVTVHAAMLDDDDSRTAALLFGCEEEGKIETGVFEEAHGGTLYLDEVASFSGDMQKRILKALVDNCFTREGGTQKVHVDVRVISSSSGDIPTRLENGDLREDLYHRVSVVALQVPELKQRREDIPHLVEHFADIIGEQLNCTPHQIHPDAMAVLQSYDWPGNVRQLRNCVEYMLIAAQARGLTELTHDTLPADILNDTGLDSTQVTSTHIMSLPLRDAREIFEREYLLAQIDRFSGNISRTAEFVGMERSALHRKIKSLGIVSGRRTKSPVG